MLYSWDSLFEACFVPTLPCLLYDITGRNWFSTYTFTVQSTPSIAKNEIFIVTMLSELDLNWVKLNQHATYLGSQSIHSEVIIRSYTRLTALLGPLRWQVKMHDYSILHRLTAKFHYMGPTGPDPQTLLETRVRAGLRQSLQTLSGLARLVKFSYNKSIAGLIYQHSNAHFS